MEISDIAINVAICVAAYLIGSLSPSILITRLNGVDIRKEGSKNAGSTNVLRVMGAKFGLIVFALDVTKGALVTLVPMLIFGSITGYVASVGVVVGHIFSCFHKFKAGKGVAPAVGVALVVDWRLGLCCLALGFVLILLCRRVSVGSISAAICLPIISATLLPDYVPFALIIAVLIVFMHRANIGRLLKGEEKPIF